MNDTCTYIANVDNRFNALSDTQFIENNIRDDGFETEASFSEIQVRGVNFTDTFYALITVDNREYFISKPKEKGSNENITVKLNEALGNGISVLKTRYDIIAVTNSDSEDDEPQ